MKRMKHKIRDRTTLPIYVEQERESTTLTAKKHSKKEKKMKNREIGSS